MKGLVVYDSYYGNTQRVAEAIAQELEAQGHQAELRSVRKEYPGAPQGDVLFLGSPVRLGTTTRRVKKYVEGLDKSYWSGKPLVVSPPSWSCRPMRSPSGRRAGRNTISWRGASCRACPSPGLKPLNEQLWVDVSGLKGPWSRPGWSRPGSSRAPFWARADPSPSRPERPTGARAASWPLTAGMLGDGPRLP